MSKEELEELLYSNMSAYNIYDDMLQKIIPLLFDMLAYEKTEEFEKCSEIQNTIRIITDKTKYDLLKLFGKKNDKIFGDYIQTIINEIIININNEE